MNAPTQPHELSEVCAHDIVALTAPGFEEAPAELGLLDAASLRATLLSDSAGGGRAGVHSLATKHGESLILRPFRRGGLLDRLGRPPTLHAPDRWFDELRVTHELRQRDAPVPRPAFAIACRAAPSRAGAWLGAVASLRIDNARDALDYARSCDRNDRELAAAAAACGRAVRAFHDCGGRHRDLHLGNLLVQEGANQAWLVDLDRARVGASPSPRRRARELARLARSAVKRGLERQLAPSAARAFSDAYLGDDETLSTELARAWRTERWAIPLHRLGY